MMGGSCRHGRMLRREALWVNRSMDTASSCPGQTKKETQKHTTKKKSHRTTENCRSSHDCPSYRQLRQCDHVCSVSRERRLPACIHACHHVALSPALVAPSTRLWPSPGDFLTLFACAASSTASLPASAYARATVRAQANCPMCPIHPRTL